MKNIIIIVLLCFVGVLSVYALVVAVDPSISFDLDYYFSRPTEYHIEEFEEPLWKEIIYEEEPLEDVEVIVVCHDVVYDFDNGEWGIECYIHDEDGYIVSEFM